MYVKSSAVKLFFVVEIPGSVVLKCFSNVVSLIPKYFLSRLLGADTAVLYTMFAVILKFYYQGIIRLCFYNFIHSYQTFVGYLFYRGKQWQPIFLQ